MCKRFDVCISRSLYHSCRLLSPGFNSHYIEIPLLVLDRRPPAGQTDWEKQEKLIALIDSARLYRVLASSVSGK